MDAKREVTPSGSGGERAILCLTRAFSADAPHCARPQLHFHGHIELLYGCEGTATVLIGSRKYPLAPDDLVIIDVGEPHEVICDAGTVRYHVVKFLPQILEPRSPSLVDVRLQLPLWRRHFARFPHIDKALLAKSGIGWLIGEIMDEWEMRTRGYESVLCADIMKLFAATFRMCCPASDTAEPMPESLRHALAAALDAAQKNPVGMTAKDAAGICGLSYSYFSRSFKAAFGVSFTAYLESMRMREAERLLLTTDREVTDIAAALGFATTSYFIERFRFHYGTTPRAFRRTVISADSAGT